MQIKENIDLVIYHVAWMLSSPTEYFSRRETKRNNYRKEIESLRDEIVSPETSLMGLKNRYESIKLVMLSFLVFGVTLQVIFGLTIGLLRLPADLAPPVFSFCFYFTSTSLVICYRYIIAFLEHRKFTRLAKQNKSADNFKISHLAEPRIYDLLPGIIFAVLFYLFLSSSLVQ